MVPDVVDAMTLLGRVIVDLENLQRDVRELRFMSLIPPSEVPYNHLLEAERHVTDALLLLQADIETEETL